MKMKNTNLLKSLIFPVISDLYGKIREKTG